MTHAAPMVAQPPRQTLPDAHGGAHVWRYGALGMPLAFVALPLYLQLPNHYARAFGVSLAALGLVLLAARVFDAVIDPWIGRWLDRLYARSPRRVLRVGAWSAGVLALAFALMFAPPAGAPTLVLAWLCVTLLVAYGAYSVLSVAHQSWGAMLGGDALARSRIVAWREGFGLAGVLVAAVLPAWLGFGVTSVVLAALLAIGWMAWQGSQHPQPQDCARTQTPAQPSAFASVRPFALPAFRWLVAVFALNGIASAIPATLVLFFIQDRLRAPAALEPLFLLVYFLAAALALPLWLRVVARLGLARTWLVGMALAVAVFVWAWTLGQGEVAAFFLICALSGVALGADLSVPPAMLAGVIGAAGHRGLGDGRYFGWWNFTAKLNLALAAGLALPLLGWAGYRPGTTDPEALDALALAYCLLPCGLKLAAAALLHLGFIREERST